MEQRIILGKRWLFYYGVDGIVRAASLKQTNQFDGGSQTNTDTSTGFGIAPLAGIQFNISDRVCLSTESLLEMMYTMGTSKNTGTGTAAGFNSESKTTETSINPVLPAFLYINISF